MPASVTQQISSWACGQMVANLPEPARNLVKRALLDTIGVLISVPISIYLGKIFGSKMEELKRSLHDLHLILGFLVFALVFVIIWRSRARPKADPPPPPAP